MDRPLSALVSGECWTGLLQSGEPSQKPLCFTSAHGEVVHAAWSLPTNSKIMIYQATVSKVNDIMVLVENDNTQWIRIPADDQIDWSVSQRSLCRTGVHWSGRNIYGPSDYCFHGVEPLCCWSPTTSCLWWSISRWHQSRPWSSSSSCSRWADSWPTVEWFPLPTTLNSRRWERSPRFTLSCVPQHTQGYVGDSRWPRWFWSAFRKQRKPAMCKRLFRLWLGAWEWTFISECFICITAGLLFGPGGGALWPFSAIRSTIFLTCQGWSLCQLLGTSWLHGLLGATPLRAKFCSLRTSWGSLGMQCMEQINDGSEQTNHVRVSSTHMVRSWTNALVDAVHILWRAIAWCEMESEDSMFSVQKLRRHAIWPPKRPHCSSPCRPPLNLTRKSWVYRYWVNVQHRRKQCGLLRSFIVYPWASMWSWG